VLTNDQREQLLRLATRDPLTGVGNRRALEDQLVDVIAARGRDRIEASILMFDLDHFKSINDAHGHEVGDQFLVHITSLIGKRIRATDKLYRVGGEEFVLLLQGDRLEAAAGLAEKLRRLIEDNQPAARGPLTASFGVAELRKGESERSWLRRADEALYEAKRLGRNRVATAR
jgi:diguanylate cyclase (GGDEF)-like protein